MIKEICDKNNMSIYEVVEILGDSYFSEDEKSANEKKKELEGMGFNVKMSTTNCFNGGVVSYMVTPYIEERL
jgi:hypothetical protein